MAVTCGRKKPWRACTLQLPWGELRIYDACKMHGFCFVGNRVSEGPHGQTQHENSPTPAHRRWACVQESS